MRVVIWTSGGGSAGIGHLTRCQALIPSLLNCGAEVVVIAEADVRLAPFIEVEGIEVQYVSDRKSALLALQAVDAPFICIADRPDLTLQDSRAHYAAGASKLVLLASSQIGSYVSDLAIVDDPILIEPGPPLAKQIEVGVHLHMVRSDVLALRPFEPLEINKGDPVSLLIALSGSDPGELTEKLFASLSRIVYVGGLPFHLRVVIGPGWEAKRRENFLKNVHENECKSFDIIDNQSSLANAIASVSAVVTLGGRTTYEAFALGRPAFCLPCTTTADYVSVLNSQNLALAIDPNPELAAMNIISAFQSPAESNARAKRAFNIVTLGAADRVAAICLKDS